MIGKKETERKSVVCRYLGEGSVFMLTLPKEHRESFKKAFEGAFDNIVKEKDSIKIKSGIIHEAGSGDSSYVTLVMIVPPIFPSKTQQLLSEFCLARNLELSPFLLDPDQE